MTPDPEGRRPQGERVRLQIGSDTVILRRVTEAEWRRGDRTLKLVVHEGAWWVIEAAPDPEAAVGALARELRGE